MDREESAQKSTNAGLPSEAERENFLNSLDEDNSWVLLADSIRWNKLIHYFISRYGLEKYHAGVSERSLLGALIIKYRLKLSSSATIRLIQENQYIQYFCQAGRYYGNPPLTADMLRNIRDLVGQKEWGPFKKYILTEASPKRFLNPKRIIQNIPLIGKIISGKETKNLHGSLGIEYDSRKISRRLEKQKRRKSASSRKKTKKIIDIIVWIILLSLFLYSFVMIISEPDWKGKRKKKSDLIKLFPESSIIFAANK